MEFKPRTDPNYFYSFVGHVQLNAYFHKTLLQCKHHWADDLPHPKRAPHHRKTQNYLLRSPCICRRGLVLGTNLPCNSSPVLITPPQLSPFLETARKPVRGQTSQLKARAGVPVWASLTCSRMILFFSHLPSALGAGQLAEMIPKPLGKQGEEEKGKRASWPAPDTSSEQFEPA